MDTKEIEAGLKATKETLKRAMDDVRDGSITHEALKRIIQGVNEDLQKLKQELKTRPNEGREIHRDRQTHLEIVALNAQSELITQKSSV